jgi:hypothetical protein
VLSFEEALKLNLALDLGVHALGRLNRATKKGKRAALQVVVHLGAKARVRVLNGVLPNLESRASVAKNPPPPQSSTAIP